jgi:hypothetical protein
MLNWNLPLDYGFNFSFSLVVGQMDIVFWHQRQDIFGFVAVTTGTETVLFSFCTLTATVGSKQGKLLDSDPQNVIAIVRLWQIQL